MAIGGNHTGSRTGTGTLRSLDSSFTASRADFDGPVLVTGAGGCIGAWVLAILTRAGIAVTGFDLSQSRARARLLLGDAELSRVRWLVGDVTDPAAVGEALAESGARAIIHLAGLQTPACRSDPVAGARVNVIGTVNVFEAARAHQVLRVAYASSIAAHAMDPKGGYQPSLYGAYKACDEMIARVYYHDWGVPSVGLRPGIVYGLGRDQGLSCGTTLAIRAAAAGADYTVRFSGPVSYLYAGEIASAFVQAVSRERGSAAVYDCNGGAATVEAGLAATRELAPGARLSASGDPLPVPVDISDEPLRGAIGDYGAISLEAGIAETYHAFAERLADGRFAGFADLASS